MVCLFGQFIGVLAYAQTAQGVRISSTEGCSLPKHIYSIRSRRQN